MRHLDEGTLQAWLDGPRSGMDEREREDVRRHVEACARCRALVEELREATDRVEALLAPAGEDRAAIPPFGEVVARSRSTRGGRPRRFRVPATWAAGIIAAIGIGYVSAEYRVGRIASEEGAAAPVEELERAAAPSADAEATVASEADAVAGADAPAAPARQDEAAGGRAETESPVLQDRPVTPVAPPGEAKVAETIPEPERRALPAADSVAVRAEERLAERRTSAEMSSGARERIAASVVRGRITDESGRPLQSAQVFVEGTGIGGLTDRDGTFELSVARGAMQGRDSIGLMAQLIGYATVAHTVGVGAGDTAFADLRMTQQSIALDQIVVTGAPRPTARDEAAAAPAAEEAFAPVWGAPWTTVDRADAEGGLGVTLLTVPDRPVRSVEIGQVDGVTVVRVVQDAGDATGGVTLLQSRSDVVLAAPPPDGTTVETVRRGDLTVVAWARMGRTELRALLERMR